MTATLFALLLWSCVSFDDQGTFDCEEGIAISTNEWGGVQWSVMPDDIEADITVIDFGLQDDDLGFTRLIGKDSACDSVESFILKVDFNPTIIDDLYVSDRVELVFDGDHFWMSQDSPLEFE